MVSAPHVYFDFLTAKSPVTAVSFANWGFICLSYLFQIVFEILPGEDGGMYGVSGLPPGRSA